jgi:hypothetical protein
MRIHDPDLRAVVFLYADDKSAQSGTGSGASAVLVAYTTASGHTVTYVMTNTHVVLNGGIYLRLNTLAGGTRVMELPVDKWTHAAGAVDACVYAMSPETLADADHDPINWNDAAMTEADVSNYAFGPGDEVIMLGRLAGYDGMKRNHPVARFGNVARMPEEPVKDAHGDLVTAFLVEMRSLSGFSGSPVFGVIPSGSFRGEGQAISLGQTTMFLLGLDCGHITLKSPVVNAQGTRHDDWEVREHTGMSLVIPAWILGDLLAIASTS